MEHLRLLTVAEPRYAVDYYTDVIEILFASPNLVGTSSPGGEVCSLPQESLIENSKNYRAENQCIE